MSKINLQRVIVRQVHFVVVIPVPIVVRPTGEGLVHRHNAQCIEAHGRVASVLTEAGIIWARALCRLNSLVIN